MGGLNAAACRAFASGIPSRIGTDSIHWRSGTWRMTWSTTCAAVSYERREIGSDCFGEWPLKRLPGYVGCTLEPAVSEANFWPIG